MCILALITRFSERFPFILITNRDEHLARLTHPLGVDAATGLLWAVDGVAGGSWLGLELAQGRLATVTNCRRAPSAPLCFRGGQAAEAAARQRYPRLFDSQLHPTAWRGACTVAEAVAHTKVVPAGAEGRSLLYEPPTSRGAIIRNFLADGTLPGDSSESGSEEGLPPLLQPPFYAGYNLVTCESLFGKGSSSNSEDGQGEMPFTAHYTSNRFHAACREPLSHGEVHCLQNSFMDNYAEPRSAALRDLFRQVLADTVPPAPVGEGPPLAASEAEAIATAFADRCLSATPNYDVAGMLRAEEEETASTATTAAKIGQGKKDGTAATTLEGLVRSSDPRLGFSPEELAALFPAGGDEPLTDGDAAAREIALQRNVYVAPIAGYGTRVQSVVFTERTVDGGAAEYQTHFCQRAAPAAAGASGSPWAHFIATKDGLQQLS